MHSGGRQPSGCLWFACCSEQSPLIPSQYQRGFYTLPQLIPHLLHCTPVIISFSNHTSISHTRGVTDKSTATNSEESHHCLAHVNKTNANNEISISKPTQVKMEDLFISLPLSLSLPRCTSHPSTCCLYNLSLSSHAGSNEVGRRGDFERRMKRLPM